MISLILYVSIKDSGLCAAMSDSACYCGTPYVAAAGIRVAFVMLWTLVFRILKSTLEKNGIIGKLIDNIDDKGIYDQRVYVGNKYPE